MSEKFLDNSIDLSVFDATSGQANEAVNDSILSEVFQLLAIVLMLNCCNKLLPDDLGVLFASTKGTKSLKVTVQVAIPGVNHALDVVNELA